MTIPQILKELEPYTGRFPMKAMRAAVEQYEAVAPELLKALETVAEDPVAFAKREHYMLHVFATFLLAQFREKRAFPHVVKIVSTPGEVPFDLYGDTITEGLSRILGSLYDGNPTLLEELVECEEVNDYVRNAAIDTYLVLEHSGQMPRDQVVEYYRELFRSKFKRDYSHAWNGLVSAVADMPLPELLEDVRRVFADGLVDPGFADLEGIERDIQSPHPRHRDRHRLIADAIAEMEWWAAFQPERSRPKKKRSKIEAPNRPDPAVRERGIGRNDPCPCGSGKKFKKCCGQPGQLVQVGSVSAKIPETSRPTPSTQDEASEAFTTKLAELVEQIRKEYPQIRPFEEEDDINWWNEGLDALHAGRLDAAEQTFKKLLLTQPNHSDGYHGLGLVHAKKNRHETAEIFLRAAVVKAEQACREGHTDAEVVEWIRGDLNRVLSQ